MYCVLKKEKEDFTTREEGEMKWAMFPSIPPFTRRDNSELLSKDVFERRKSTGS